MTVDSAAQVDTPPTWVPAPPGSSDEYVIRQAQREARIVLVAGSAAAPAPLEPLSGAVLSALLAGGPDVPTLRAVHLVGVTVEGDLDLSDVELPTALVLTGCTVVGRVILDRMRVASLCLDGTTLEAGPDDGSSIPHQRAAASAAVGPARPPVGGRPVPSGALSARGAVVAQDLSAQRLTCVAFDGRALRVCGDLDLRDSVVPRVDLARATVTGTLTWRPAERAEHVDVRHAEVAELVDDLDDPGQGDAAGQGTGRSWPPRAYRLQGFRYGLIPHRSTADRDRRLAWLAGAEEGYVPSSYDHLASVYRAAGHDNTADRVLVTKQWDRYESYSRRSAEKLAAGSPSRKARPARGVGAVAGETPAPDPAAPPVLLTPWGRAKHATARWGYPMVSRLLCLTIGYGYRTRRALGFLLTLLLVGGFLLHWVEATGGVVAKAGARVEYWGHLHALDLLVPLANLRYRDSWSVDSTAALVLTVSLTLFGWLLGLAVVAGLAGVFKRH